MCSITSRMMIMSNLLCSSVTLSDILADQCQVSVVGMYAVDFFCDCNLASVDVYTCHLATEIQKGLYVSSFPATDFENVGICRNRFMLFNERYYIFLCRNTLFVEI